MEKSSILIWLLTILLFFQGAQWSFSDGLNDRCGIKFMNVVRTTNFKQIRPQFASLDFNSETGFSALFSAPAGYSIREVRLSGDLFAEKLCKTTLTKTGTDTWMANSSVCNVDLCKVCAVSSCPFKKSIGEALMSPQNNIYLLNVEINYSDNLGQDRFESGSMRLPISDGTEVVQGGLLVILSAFLLGLAELVISGSSKPFLAIPLFILVVLTSSAGVVIINNHQTDVFYAHIYIVIILGIIISKLIASKNRLLGIKDS
jgi:hypothetical protein